MNNNLIKIYHHLKWLVRNQSRFDQLTEFQNAFFYGPITYNSDGLMTCMNCDFKEDTLFRKAYKAAADTSPWPGFNLQWRVYIVCYFANLVKHLEGDYVECGVNTGAYAKAVITYTTFNQMNKTFFLLDTYDGLLEHQLTDAEKKAGLDVYLSQYKNVYERVINTFKDDKVQIIKGPVPDTLIQCDASKVAYLSIDMNCAKPEIDAMSYFYDKVVPGGVIIIDDYGFPQHIEQKKAHDAFALSKKIQILSLPTGQGVILKNAY